MNVKQINAKQTKEALKYETAKQIRQLLDETLKQWEESDRADIETEILELVSEEE